MIDINKKYKTRDGRDVRIISTNINHRRYPIAAALDTGSEGEEVVTYTKDGRYHTSESQKSHYDLIEEPQERVVWLELFKYRDSESMGCLVHNNMSRAVRSKSSSTVKIFKTTIKV